MNAPLRPKAAGGLRVKAVFRHLPAYLFMFPYATSFVVFVAVPFVLALALAFMQYDLTNRDAAGFVGLRNFREALTDPYFWMALRATLLFTLLMVPAEIAAALALAVGMNAMMRGRNTVRAVLFLPGMLNVAVVAILWQWFYNREFGLFAHLLAMAGVSPVPWLSSKWLVFPAIVLMNLWWRVGGTAVILLTGLQQIPASVYEAAEIDGAGRWQQFTLITLPMLRPVLVFTSVMVAIGSFQVFGPTLILTGGGPELFTRSIVHYIYDTAFRQYRMGYGAALSWLLFMLIAGVALVQHLLLRRKEAR